MTSENTYSLSKRTNGLVEVFWLMYREKALKTLFKLLLKFKLNCSLAKIQTHLSFTDMYKNNTFSRKLREYIIPGPLAPEARIIPLDKRADSINNVAD